MKQKSILSNGATREKLEVRYVDAHCVGINTDGYSIIHWVPVKSIGKTVFYNPTDAARYAAAMSDYYDKHYAFGGTSIRRTQWEHFLEKD